MMHKGAEYVAPNAKLQAIAKKMRDHDIGAIPVCEGGKTIGMVTDRDIAIRALANGRDLSKLEAMDVMSKDVIFCRDSEEAEDAIRIMEDNKIRRLPVLNEAKKLVGMVASAISRMRCRGTSRAR
jgi:CBS domain-containing protein